MRINLGTSPLGTPPTEEQKTQIRSALGIGPSVFSGTTSGTNTGDQSRESLGLGVSDAVTFGGLTLNSSTYSAYSMNYIPDAAALSFIYAGSQPRVQVGLYGLNMHSDGVISWSSSSINQASGRDVFLYRDAAGTIAQRNGTSAQTSRVYNTFTDSSNYERGVFGWTANTLRIGTENLGTGVARGIDFVTGGTAKWGISTAGHLLAATDNTYDIGASGANRPQNLWVAANIYLGGNTWEMNSVRLKRNNRWTLGYGALDGDILLNNSTDTGTVSLLFGGTTSSFPRLKRNAATIDCRLADDSADASFNAGQLTASGGNVYFAETRISRRAMGILMMESSGDFNRLQFGGTTNLFPSIKRNAAALETRLADDSGYAGLLTGKIRATSTSAAVPAYGFTASVDSAGFGWDASGSNRGAGYYYAGTCIVGFTGGTLALSSTTSLDWSSSADGLGSADVKLFRDAAGILAQRNGTSAQESRVYNTFTDSTNYERGVFGWTANTLRIGTEKLGTGTARALDLVTDGVARLSINTSGDATLNGIANTFLTLNKQGPTYHARINFNSLGSNLATVGVDTVGNFVLQGPNSATTRIQAGNSATLSLMTGGNGTIILTTNSEAMRIVPDGNVGIGTTPNASAILDIASTTKALLLPRMTKAQRDAIPSPVAGMMVYQNDNTPGLRTYNGTNWMKYTEATD